MGLSGRKKQSFVYCSLAVFLLVILFFPNQAEGVGYPRLANYFLKWELSSQEMAELHKWDVLVLDMEVQFRHRDFLKRLRQQNPNIKLLVYITPESIIQNAGSSYSQMRRQLAAGIGEGWYLRSSSGSKLSWWPGTEIMNVANDAPIKDGQRWNQYLVKFVVDKLLATGLWDGVYYDNAWDNITWFAGDNIDYDLDGKIDSNLDYKWQEGMKYIYNETRRLAGKNYLIVGNSDSKYYTNELNGMMLENFSAGRWQHFMERYKYNEDSRQSPVVDLINSNTKNTGKISQQDMRFGLVSSLLENGYFSYDYGDTNHGQTWWYDEYDIDLGDPLASAKSAHGYAPYQPDVWQRDFSNGLAIANATGQKQTVSLGGEYEKIHGTQNPQINDGSIVTETTIDGYDGLVLLKTFSSLNDMLFRNGDFVRFFDASGNRIRNGFFIFENGYKGGDKIAHIDLDDNGKRDLVVVSKNRIMAWRDDGQIYMKVYPYTASYQGELQVAIGDLNNDGMEEIYVAPSAGYALPIKVYTRHGRKMKQDWYPYGENYAGGYSLALGHITGTRRNDLVVAKNSREALISIFDYNYQLAYQWLAWPKSNNIGANVAAGDINNDGQDEIIAGAGQGVGPIIRIFDKEGKQLGQDITAYSSLGRDGIEVMSTDVDYDGRDDVVGMNSGF